MTDPHQNVFHAYRGPLPSDAAAARQLEDNLTRALVITLRYFGDLSLLDTLGISMYHPERHYSCWLQVAAPSPDWPGKTKRYLVVIHGGPVLSVTDTRVDYAEKGRVDAVVVADNLVLAVESKLGNLVHRRQIERHCATFDIPRANISDLTWTKLARAARSIRTTRRSGTVARFVLDQFEEYLRMNGFGGLTQAHFAYFSSPVDDRDPLVKEGIRRALQELGADLQQSLGTTWHPHMLNIGRDTTNAGVVLEPGEHGAAPHLTVSINPTGLDFFANIELQDNYRRFRETWSADPNGLIAVIRELGQIQVHAPDDIPWRFRVTRRVRLGLRHYHYWNAVDISANTLAAWSDDLLRQFVENATVSPEGEGDPEILIARSYPAVMVLANNHLVETLAANAEQLKPFFAWIKEPLK